MSNFQLDAEGRDSMGTGHSRRLRRGQRVPAVIYGKGIENQMISLEHKVIEKFLQNPDFYASIIDLKVAGGKTEPVVVRDVQRHPFKPEIEHVDFLKVSDERKIVLDVPLKFTHEEESPAVLGKGIASRFLRSLSVQCLPKHMPESLEVDLRELDFDKPITTKGLALPEGVELSNKLKNCQAINIAVAVHSRMSRGGGGAESSDSADKKEGS